MKVITQVCILIALKSEASTIDPPLEVFEGNLVSNHTQELLHSVAVTSIPKQLLFFCLKFGYKHCLYTCRSYCVLSPHSSSRGWNSCLSALPVWISDRWLQTCIDWSCYVHQTGRWTPSLWWLVQAQTSHRLSPHRSTVVQNMIQGHNPGIIEQQKHSTQITDSKWIKSYLSLPWRSWQGWEYYPADCTEWLYVGRGILFWNWNMVLLNAPYIKKIK